MHSISCRAMLLDIEGTVSPVTFVYDIMFPYIRQHVGDYLKQHWESPETRETVRLIANDIDEADVDAWFFAAEDPQSLVVDTVNQLMDRDAKVTGLKQLQGMIWKDGFHQGQLIAELFPDVLPCLRQWKQDGLKLYIYSSGSIGAQKLFFGHTSEGDLLNLFAGHFDTTSGNKKEPESYRNIARETGISPAAICFVSDVPAELDAAQLAGMQVVLRPAADLSTAGDYLQISSFAELNPGLSDRTEK